MSPSADQRLWADAALAAALVAVDPHGFGGILLRGANDAGFAAWLFLLKQCLPPEAKVTRVPAHIRTDRLVGGLDVASSLIEGKPVLERGVLGAADHGVLVLTSAERMPAESCVLVAAAMDEGVVAVARDGLSTDCTARFGLVALDEGQDEFEKISTILAERLAFHIELPQMVEADIEEILRDLADVSEARRCILEVRNGDDMREALCNAALALGIRSVRVAIFAAKAARAHAALMNRREVTKEDVSAAARLVLAPRALMLPDERNGPHEQKQEPEEQDKPEDGADDDTTSEKPLNDVVLDAVRVALPLGLLQRLGGAGGKLAASRSSSGASVNKNKFKRGRPIGVRRGHPWEGARLHVLETLRAAARWQKLRRAKAPGRSGIIVSSEDFRTRRFKQRSETTTIFAVDASGSAALHRLGEAKGAVELILADCYVRRDKVALLAFRGRSAELLLPPTRSLQRAKRNLAALPGGGGTPLSAAIDLSFAVAESVRRSGGKPVLVFLTDGRGNVARDGSASRATAKSDALASARTIRAESFKSLLIDVSPSPQDEAQSLAREMGASYLALPHADANVISQAVLSAMK